MLKAQGDSTGFSKRACTAVLGGGPESMSQGAPGWGLRRQVGPPSHSERSTCHPGDAGDGTTIRKRGAWGHLGPIPHEIPEKRRNLTPWPVLSPEVSEIGLGKAQTTKEDPVRLTPSYC